MTDPTPVVTQLTAHGRRLLVSPAWFVPFDDFRRRRSVPGLSVAVDRWDGARWQPAEVRATVTPGGVIAFPGLGRRREPALAEPELFRARFAAAGYRPLYSVDDEPFDAAKTGREFVAHPYDDEHPPEVGAEPDVVTFLPDRTFIHSPNTRIVHGLVRRAGAGTPVGNALVEATGQSTDGLGAWRERALCDAGGEFRLALRWSGRPAGSDEPPGTEVFTLTATERQGHTGQLGIRLPADLGLTHVIEISQ